MTIKQVLRGIALCCAFLAATLRASRGEEASLRTDVEAAIRALGFLDSLPRDNTIDIGVVYSPGPQGKAQAQVLANALNGMQGPSSKSLHAEALGADELAQTQKRLDVIFLSPGSAGNSTSISDFIRRHHVVSISNDPACLDTRCCVLMVSTANGTNIVLDTALADSVGAHFSTVFAMMVKRR